MAGASARKAACGLRTAASSSSSLSEIVADLKSGLGDDEFQHIILFYAVEHDAEQLSVALEFAFPGVPVTGCSTAGEISAGGMMEGGIVAIAFPRKGFQVHSGLVENAREFGVERATELSRRLRSQMTTSSDLPRHQRAFAMMLVDGLSNAEESLVAAVHWQMEDVQLIGGSAGDGLSFEKTSLLYEGRTVNEAAILILVETEYQFKVFKTQNFEPTPIKLVVTGADPENRVVTELNAEPAAREYAAAIGLLPDDLGPFSFASHPLVVKVGGDYYCRSIRNMNDDGSLTFFCAIDEGVVFTVARPRDMVKSTASVLEDVGREVGGTDFVIGFDCVLRRLDAETHQVRHQFDELYKSYGVVGFHTYGEQFNAMHLNQTLTGVAFGAGRRTS